MADTQQWETVREPNPQPLKGLRWVARVKTVLVGLLVATVSLLVATVTLDSPQIVVLPVVAVSIAAALWYRTRANRALEKSTTALVINRSEVGDTAIADAVHADYLTLVSATTGDDARADADALWWSWCTMARAESKALENGEALYAQWCANSVKARAEFIKLCATTGQTPHTASPSESGTWEIAAGVAPWRSIKTPELVKTALRFSTDGTLESLPETAPERTVRQ